jgi:putative nucleotidyltransferase with HDIG domain
MIVLCGTFLLLFALGFAGFDQRYVFLSAGLAVALASMSGGWVNGIFMALVFNFTFYSVHPGAGIQGLLLNFVIFCVLAVLADRLNFRGKSAGSAEKRGEEKIFNDKIINAFMIGHEMMTGIKKGVPHDELYSIFAGNASNLTGAEHVLLYSARGNSNGGMKLVFSSGKYAGKNIRTEVKAADIRCDTGRNISADRAGFIKEAGGSVLIIPLKDTGIPEGMAVIYREKEFSYSDIYVVEFLGAQALMIMEKQDFFTEMSDNYRHIIEALTLAIDTKDHDTHGHCMSTMKYAVEIARKMKIPPAQLESIKCAALLHDIGKIKISSDILNKPDKLTDAEFEIIKRHPEEGVYILDKLNIFGEILPLIKHHHEHYDGKGYPQKLSGEDIPLGSRICAVADAYSVMTADRPYHRARTKNEAVAELKRCSGTQFDGRIVNVFLNILSEDDPAGRADGPAN